MSSNRLLGTTKAVHGRYSTALRKSPAIMAPAIVMPLCFFLAFAGGLSSLGSSPQFPYPDYTSFTFVFVLYLASAFAGIFLCLTLANDFDIGFASRFFIGAPHRIALILGIVTSSAIPVLIVELVLFGVGVLAGMQVSGSVLQIAGLVVLSFAISIATVLFAVGVVLRVRSALAVPITMMSVFVLLFIGPVYVPRSMLEGWLETAANLTPITPLLEAGRGLLVGESVHIGLAIASMAGLLAVLLLWAWTGLRRAEKAGGS